MKKKSLSIFFGAAAATFSSAAGATNGMNLEGYGPIALGIGGASLAYDNGTAAVMNNPATLGLVAPGQRLDLALGFLGPDISVSSAGSGAQSDADAFYMPAVGWVRKKHGLTYGVGVFGQGGMGTEYAASTWLGDPSQGINGALAQGLVNRSEVSVGRMIFPLVFEASSQTHVGGTLDFVWAGLDLQMALSEAQFQDLANPAAQTIGTASGTLVQTFGTLYEPFGGSGISTLHHAYFDFTNDSDFTGKANGTGFAGKLGIVYEASPQLTVGATYHSETYLNDLQADATLSMGVEMDDGTGTYTDMVIPLSGKVSVRDFQWPSTFGVGAAYTPNEKWLLAVDIKRINWSETMDKFRMVFHVNDTATNGAFAGQAIEAVLFQDWDNQTVVSLGAAYKVDSRLTVRAGYNGADNPIPASFINALFPATVEDHYTLGAGYDFNDDQSINGALSYAPRVTTANPGDGGTIAAVTHEHSQLSWQTMYTRRFR